MTTTDQPRPRRTLRSTRSRWRQRFWRSATGAACRRQQPISARRGAARALSRRSLHAGHAARAEDRPRHLRLHRRGLCRARNRCAVVEAGVRDVRIVEKGRLRRHLVLEQVSGAQCDTASMVYMPLLEETGHMPSEKYAHAPEIMAHCQRIGKQYGLYETRCSTPRSKPRLGRGEIALDHSYQPRRCLHRAVRRHGDGAAALPNCLSLKASSPRHSFHPAAGITTTPAYRRGAPMGKSGQNARRHHRHRGHVRAMRRILARACKEL